MIDSMFDRTGNAIRRAVAGALTSQPSPQPVSYRQPDNVDNRCLLDEIVFDGVAGEIHNYIARRRMTGLIVSVKTGSVDIYLNTGGGGGSLRRVPSLHVGQINEPKHIELPLGIHSFTAVSSGQPANLVNQACILVEGI